MSGLFGWHVVIAVTVFAAIALALVAIYWIARLGARRGASDVVHRERHN